ncbi:MAG: hypothetical protein HKN88_05405 [Gammaproteobacteria bacterium]|nr:hypothetical protein [Gammaproteobacteria bacterium]NNC97490.1 hypothetical protein [Gammaproteobacteria bacterium]NNM13594.1 hypothetical protein [Gammaproteobacteria bacterium]
MRYIQNVLIAIDQLGNALAGGHPDNTVSARVGFFSEHATMGRICWKMLEKIIDFAFYPLEGPGHCKRAYLKDMQEEFFEASKIPYIILSLFILLTTPLIGIILHLLVLVFPGLGWEAKQKALQAQQSPDSDDSNE